ncbi:MAG: NERD domain-containing protein [Bacteroidales bacterium]|nr:NERD domain-containing protein [Bacteroidales bacterium]
MMIIAVVAAVALLLFGVSRVTVAIPQLKGAGFERSVSSKLRRLPEEYCVIDNAVFVSNGASTQIDHIVVSPYGVFVIETKGYKGWITGGENTQYWTQTIYRNKYRLYNPILQNAGHVRHLRRLLGAVGDVPIVPIVVFENDANIKVNATSIVINVYHLLDVIRGYREVCISEGLRSRIIEVIQAERVTDREVLRRHKSFANSRRRESDRRVMEGRCPRCGGELVRREGRYGSFWGCSNYPSCKYILKGRDRW